MARKKDAQSIESKIQEAVSNESSAASAKVEAAMGALELLELKFEEKLSIRVLPFLGNLAPSSTVGRATLKQCRNDNNLHKQVPPRLIPTGRSHRLQYCFLLFRFWRYMMTYLVDPVLPGL